MAEGRDLLAIEGLEVETRIGVHPFERRSLRRLSLDLEFPCAAQSAAARDELAEALDYDGVAEAVRAFAAGATYRLVESFAEGLAAELLARFPMDWIRITLRKPGAVPGARGVRLCIERRRGAEDGGAGRG